MRHVVSILLASILAPTTLLLVDDGLSGVDSARSGSFAEDPFGHLAALGTLFLAGLIYGALVMMRLSPVGPGFAGLAMMATSGWAVLDPTSYQETFGKTDVHMGSAVGPWGLGMLLGAPLVATLTSPRRWRNEEDGRSNRDPADSTHLTPTLPMPRTLPDLWPARPEVPEVPEAPTVPIALLPRRIPTVPPDMPCATPAIDGHGAVPMEDTADMRRPSTSEGR